VTRGLRAWLGGTGARLVLTVWFVYALHATTNVVRETYLALSLAERFSIRVDEYLGLHPDIFEIPGRGAYINNNPGASVLGALPYAVARPALAGLFALKPGLIAPKPPATYDDPRPNRTKFMNLARARGLDVKLGLAALITQAGLMAPLGVLAALLVLQYYRERGVTERTAAGIALLYAFGTPIFFRSGFLNQNAILSHLTLGAWILMVGLRPRDDTEPLTRRQAFGVGALLGFGVVVDYSAVPLLLVFGLWVLAASWKRGWQRALGNGLSCAAGASIPLFGLLAYQWAAFGSPWFPAQRYMPPTEYSVIGWNGFFVPTAELLIGNLFDPRYGLFVFCPLLLAAFAAPFVRRLPGDPTRTQLAWIGAACVALYLFSSANQFATLQWNTGVRYLVPAAPLLFMATVPVLRAMPKAPRWALVGVTLLVSAAVSMTRESVPEALRLIFSDGPTLPLFLVLERMASGYPALQFGALGPWLVLGVSAVLLALVWRQTLRALPVAGSER
jgi:hypothetical protein